MHLPKEALGAVSEVPPWIMLCTVATLVVWDLTRLIIGTLRTAAWRINTDQSHMTSRHRSRCRTHSTPHTE